MNVRLRNSLEKVVLELVAVETRGHVAHVLDAHRGYETVLEIQKVCAGAGHARVELLVQVAQLGLGDSDQILFSDRASQSPHAVLHAHILHSEERAFHRNQLVDFGGHAVDLPVLVFLQFCDFAVVVELIQVILVNFFKLLVDMLFALVPVHRRELRLVLDCLRFRQHLFYSARMVEAEDLVVDVRLDLHFEADHLHAQLFHRLDHVLLRNLEAELRLGQFLACLVLPPLDQLRHLVFLALHFEFQLLFEFSRFVSFADQRRQSLGALGQLSVEDRLECFQPLADEALYFEMLLHGLDVFDAGQIRVLLDHFPALTR